jgi:hypothetical protein
MIAKTLFLAKDKYRIGARILRDHGLIMGGGQAGDRMGCAREHSRPKRPSRPDPV